MQTPWGESQTENKIADGIIFYSTAGHGGIKLSPERLVEMPDSLRLPGSFYDGGCWFEEDCEWARVALAFPQYFRKDTQHALDMLTSIHPEVIADFLRECREKAAAQPSEAAEEAMKDALYDQPQFFPGW